MDVLSQWVAVRNIIGMFGVLQQMLDSFAVLSSSKMDSYLVQTHLLDKGLAVLRTTWEASPEQVSGVSGNLVWGGFPGGVV